MTTSAANIMLSEAIDASGLTLAEIAEQTGIKKPNAIALMKAGVTKVPLHRVPALARTLGMDERDLFLAAIEDDVPGTIDRFVRILGNGPREDAELIVLLIVRMHATSGDSEMEAPFRRALSALIDLTG